MGENRRLQTENVSLRARLHQEREQAEADQDLHNSWHAVQEAEIERLEKELEKEEKRKRRGIESR
jgi:regulator of replication initiation timing